nr:MAG TPA: hypothetical protein [Caudoviricetes sp.]
MNKRKKGTVQNVPPFGKTSVKYRGFLLFTG